MNILVGLLSSPVHYYIELCCTRKPKNERRYRDGLAEKYTCTYPYGLNNNIRGVGNISKQNDVLIVWKFFDKHFKTRKRKSKRPSHNHPKKSTNPCDWLKNKLGNYKSMCFLHKCISRLKNTTLRVTGTLVEEQLHLHIFPTHLLLILKDLD